MDKQGMIFLLALAGIAIFAGAAFSNFFLFLLLLALAAVFLVVRPALFEVREYERLIVFRFGKLRGVEGPGWVLVLNGIDKHVLVDLRVQAVDIPPQEVISRDNIKFKIDAVIYIKVTDPLKSVITVQDYKQAATLYVQAQIRDAVGKMPLEEVIAQTDEMNDRVSHALAEVTRDWGVQCIKVEVQSIEPPQSLVDAMKKRKEAQEYKARLEIESQAKELQIDILNRAASKISDTTMSYLYLDALKKMSEGKSNKIIFPLELSRLASLLSSKIGAEQSPEHLAKAVAAAMQKPMQPQIVQAQTPEQPAAPAGEKKRDAEGVDYDKIVSELLDAYRRKQTQILEEESGEKKQEPRPEKKQ